MNSFPLTNDTDFIDHTHAATHAALFTVNLALGAVEVSIYDNDTAYLMFATRDADPAAAVARAEAFAASVHMTIVRRELE